MPHRHAVLSNVELVKQRLAPLRLGQLRCSLEAKNIRRFFALFLDLCRDPDFADAFDDRVAKEREVARFEIREALEDLRREDALGALLLRGGQLPGLYDYDLEEGHLFLLDWSTGDRKPAPTLTPQDQLARRAYELAESIRISPPWRLPLEEVRSLAERSREIDKRIAMRLRRLAEDLEDLRREVSDRPALILSVLMDLLDAHRKGPTTGIHDSWEHDCGIRFGLRCIDEDLIGPEEVAFAADFMTGSGATLEQDIRILSTLWDEVEGEVQEGLPGTSVWFDPVGVDAPASHLSHVAPDSAAAGTEAERLQGALPGTPITAVQAWAIVEQQKLEFKAVRSAFPFTTSKTFKNRLQNGSAPFSSWVEGRDWTGGSGQWFRIREESLEELLADLRSRDRAVQAGRRADRRAAGIGAHYT